MYKRSSRGFIICLWVMPPLYIHRHTGSAKHIAMLFQPLNVELLYYFFILTGYSTLRGYLVNYYLLKLVFLLQQEASSFHFKIASPQLQSGTKALDLFLNENEQLMSHCIFIIFPLSLFGDFKMIPSSCHNEDLYLGTHNTWNAAQTLNHI